MKSLCILIASALLLAVSCSAGDSWVRVEGNQFIDPQGKEIVFRGLCFSDPVKLVREGQWNERYFAEAAVWGSNVVRFAVHPANLNAMGWEETFQAMDQGVEWAKQHGLYVIMDWHSIGNLKEEKYTSPIYYTTREPIFRSYPRKSTESILPSIWNRKASRLRFGALTPAGPLCLSGTGILLPLPRAFSSRTICNPLNNNPKIQQYYG